jgi:hypothetical protein
MRGTSHHAWPLHESFTNSEEDTKVTIVGFIVWLIANNVGGHEPLLFDPVSAWTATLMLAIGLDLGAAHARGTSKSR